MDHKSLEMAGESKCVCVWFVDEPRIYFQLIN